jgi:pyruvate dehydrogenase E2 component (dihydrolipoamide acetyltransferase)
MTNGNIQALTMPKWGLAMKEGKIGEWLTEEGLEITTGEEVLEVETDKITSAVETPHKGILRRKVASSGEVLPVGSLLAVIAESSVSENMIDHFVEDFQQNFVEEETLEEDLGPQPQSVETDSGRIQYLKQGEGEASVILLHGFGGDLNNWLFNHPALSENHSVYAFDLLGHGGSSKEVGDGSIFTLTNSILQAVSRIGIENSNWVGHSLGGAIAMNAAKISPETVKSLTLIASAGLGTEINSTYLKGFSESQSRRELKPHVELLFNDPSLVTRQLLEDLLKFKRIDGVQESLLKIRNDFIQDDLQVNQWRDVLENESLKTLAIWGDNDQILPSNHTSELPTHVQVQILEGYGHMVQMEAAMEVNRLILQFWENC